MWHPEDRTSRISQMMLRHSVIRGQFMRVGSGVAIRARELPDGYEVRIRTGEKVTSLRIHIKAQWRARHAKDRPAKCLICAGCDKLTTRHLYIDWDTMSARCAKCMGLYNATTQIKGRLPTIYDYDDVARFKRLLRTKLQYDIWAFECASMKSLTAEEFFMTRPYLVPEFVAMLHEVDPVMYKKMLKGLWLKYRYALRSHRPRELLRHDAEWLDKQLQDRIVNGYHLSEKESKWVSKQLAKRLSIGGKDSGGNQSTTKQGQLNLQPLETDSSSLRMSSKVVMSAIPAGAVEEWPVTNVTEKDTTNEASEILNALHAKQKET